MPVDEFLATELERVYLSGVWYHPSAPAPPPGQKHGDEINCVITTIHDACADAVFRHSVRGTKYIASWIDGNTVHVALPCVLL